MIAERGFGTVAYRAVLLAAGLLVFGLLFRQLVTLLLAILITVIFAIALSMATDVLERRKVPRALGAFLALAVGVGAVVGLLVAIIPTFVTQINDFVEALPGYVDTLRDRAGAEPDDVTQAVQDFTKRYGDEPGRLVGPLASFGLGVVGVVGALFVTLLTAYFIAVDPKPIVDGVRRLAPPAYRGRADQIMSRLRVAWIGWMQGVAVDMVVTGVLLYIGLRLIGLDFAILFAVLAALFVVIPYFGAVAGGLPPLLFALAESPGKGLLVILVYGVVQQVESNVTIPLVMARTVKLHPAVIALGVIVVGQLFGFLGLVVAVPILSLIVILVEELWVKPMEQADRLDEEGPMGVPPSSEVGEVLGEREELPAGGSPTTA